MPSPDEAALCKPTEKRRRYSFSTWSPGLNPCCSCTRLQYCTATSTLEHQYTTFPVLEVGTDGQPSWKYPTNTACVLLKRHSPRRKIFPKPKKMEENSLITRFYHSRNYGAIYWSFINLSLLCREARIDHAGRGSLSAQLLLFKTLALSFVRLLRM